VKLCSITSWNEPVKKPISWNFRKKRYCEETPTPPPYKKLKINRPNVFGSISSPGLHTWRKFIRILNIIFNGYEKNSISKNINRYSKMDIEKFLSNLKTRIQIDFPVPDWNNIGSDEYPLEQCICEILSYISNKKIKSHMILEIISYKQGCSYRYNNDIAKSYKIPLHNYWLTLGTTPDMENIDRKS
jgi:hypothetical protein